MGSQRTDAREAFASAVMSDHPVAGLTHNFYLYPACFSPQFARAALNQYSKPDDVVLDPFMGGGTTVVEALAQNRFVVGSDVNSLSVFVARVKTTSLNQRAVNAVERWRSKIGPAVSYRYPRSLLGAILEHPSTNNMDLAHVRPIKKSLAAAIHTARRIRNRDARRFVTCGILKAGHWALNGRKTAATVADLREKLDVTLTEMLNGIEEFRDATISGSRISARRRLLNCDAIDIDEGFRKAGLPKKVSLVVTSPPYPGVHVLYHRWQVDGRKESGAPYWITGCHDGQYSSYYTFGDRGEKTLDTYFDSALASFLSIRRTMRKNGVVVQLIAFSNPRRQLQRYLQVMSDAGFEETHPLGDEARIWRSVPNRRWHATLRGNTSGSREVVLIHRAT